MSIQTAEHGRIVEPQVSGATRPKKNKRAALSLEERTAHNEMAAAHMVAVRIRLSAMTGTAPDDLPALFLGDMPTVMAIGIREALVARYPHVALEAWSDFLKDYTHNIFYLVRMAGGNNRHDLDRGTAESIDATHRAHAKYRIAIWFKEKNSTKV